MLPLFIHLDLLLLIVCAVSIGLLCSVKFLYNTTHYYTDLDITWPCCDSQNILPWNFTKKLRKMTMKWSFSYNSFVKIVLLLYDSFISLIGWAV